MKKQLKSFPPRTVTPGIRYTCDVCEKHFSLWLTPTSLWNLLPSPMKKRVMCVVCFRKIVRAREAAGEIDIKKALLDVPRVKIETYDKAFPFIAKLKKLLQKRRR